MDTTSPREEPSMGMRETATAMAGELTRLRHALHGEPEIGLDLPRTQRKVLAALDGLPLEVATGTALSSVTAVLRGGRPGPVVLLRGDMDALPVTELSGVDYASRVDGAMHACGHDMHVTMLVGAARLLAGCRDTLPGDVVFMFQPGEDGHGGATTMIAEGVLDAAGTHPVAAYALHVTSGTVPQGTFATRAGTIGAAVDTLEVTVRGAGGHASAPHRAKDPVPVGCEMVVALQTMVTRRFDIFDPVVLTVGVFNAGTRDNVIPDSATFQATVRTFSHASRALIETESLRLVRSIAAAYGLDADARFVPGYPPTITDAAETRFAQHTVAEVFGEQRFQAMEHPIAGAEDFSYVMAQVPGSFIRLGASPHGTDLAAAPSNHSPLAVFDDAVLPDGAALLAELASRRLVMAGGPTRTHQ
ncbi:MAG TPA: M20 family metallopeptidase [Streptosporangiaceae bacterium]|nr:M20 family metallopeptidase [Streptosporangiaceae bacterium]